MPHFSTNPSSQKEWIFNPAEHHTPSLMSAEIKIKAFVFHLGVSSVGITVRLHL